MQLAQVADISAQSVWLFETGKRTPLDRTKAQLARSLGCGSVPELFAWPPLDELVLDPA